jgi:hypothetical protein
MPAPISFLPALPPCTPESDRCRAAGRRDFSTAWDQIPICALVGQAAAWCRGSGHEKETLVFAIAALALATVSATASTCDSPALTSTAPWWEKVTYTISESGAAQACVYESSISTAGAEGCDDEGGNSAMHRAANMSRGSQMKVTIERRFTPGSEPGPTGMESGDTLLGGKVMVLAFDKNGAVRGCRELAASGDMAPTYGCREARAERFQASSRGSSQHASQGFMTILVYGHEEVLT